MNNTATLRKGHTTITFTFAADKPIVQININDGGMVPNWQEMVLNNRKTTKANARKFWSSKIRDGFQRVA